MKLQHLIFKKVVKLHQSATNYQLPTTNYPSRQPVYPVTDHDPQRVVDQVIHFKVASPRDELKYLNAHANQNPVQHCMPRYKYRQQEPYRHQHQDIQYNFRRQRICFRASP